MLGIRWRKILRDLWSNKQRTIVVVLSIAVGVFAVGAIMTTSTLLSREMTADYMAVNPAHAWVFNSGVNDDDIASIERMPEVAAAEGRTRYTLRVRVGEDEWKNIQIIGLADFNDVRINIVRPETGAWPPAERELLIERTALSMLPGSGPNGKAQIGDMATVEMWDGKTRELRIAGTTHDVNQFPAPLANMAYAYCTTDTLEWLGMPDLYTEVLVTGAGENLTKEDYNRVAEAVEKKLQKGGAQTWGFYVPTPGKHPADEIVQPMLLMLGFLGALALGLSGFLVVNTIAAILAQQIKQVGIMKAIGARRKQIIGLYLAMVAIYGGLSLVVSIPLGILVSRGFLQWMASYINFDIHSYAVPANVLAIQIAVGLLAPVISAIFPIWAGTRVTVRQAISDYGLGQPKKRQGLIDTILEHVRGLPRPMMLSIRNTFRRKGRLALTLITLTMAGAIFVGVISVRDSLNKTLELAFNYWNFEIEMSFRRPYRVDKIERAALAVPGVVAAESWDYAGVKRVRADDSKGEDFYVVAPPAETTMIRPIILEGRWLLPEDENAIVINTDVRKKEPDLKVGDTLTIELDKGDKKEEVDFRIVGVVKGAFSGPISYVNYPYLTKLMGRTGRAYQVELQLANKDAASQREMAKRLEASLNQAGVEVSRWQVMAEQRAQAEASISMLVTLLLSMSVLLAIVGGLGLMGTMSINVIERTREVGVMRAIGASNGSILKVIIVEGMLVGLISWVLGTAIAIPMSKALGAALGEVVLQSSLDYAFSTQGAVVWLALVIALAALASYLPARRASSLTVRDVLAYE